MNTQIDVTALVIVDLEKRVEQAAGKYGTRLKTNNGRSALVDAYQTLDTALRVPFY